MGPIAGLYGLEKREVPYLFWESNLDSSAVESLALVAILTTLSWLS